MKSFRSCHLMLLVIFLAGMLVSLPGYAQKRNRPEIKIGKIYAKSQKTPRFKDSEQSEKDHWGVFVVRYDVTSTGTADDWMDSLDIKWKVIFTDKTTHRVRTLELTTSYNDIEKGNNHYACAFLRPKAIHRFLGTRKFSPMEFGCMVEISSNGQILATDYIAPGSIENIKSAFKQPGAQDISERSLLPKSKTPFAPMDYDFWEPEKESAK